MGRTWMTGIAIVGVIGSGSAAIAGVVRSEVIGVDEAGASPAVTPPPATDGPLTTWITEGSPDVTTYDVGGAGWVDLAVGDASMTVEHAAAAAGWSLLEITGDATAVQVRFTDAVSVVTFEARLVDGSVTTGVAQVATELDPVPATDADVTVATAAPHAPPATTSRPPTSTSGSSAPASSSPGSSAPRTSAAPTTASPVPAPNTQPAPGSTAAPAPATTAAPAPTTAAPATTSPPSSATSAPSGSGDDDHDGDDDHGDDGAHDDD